MANVLKVLANGDNFVWKNIGVHASAQATFDVYVPAATWAGGFIGELMLFTSGGDPYTTGIIEDGIRLESLPPDTWDLDSGAAVTTASTSRDAWHTVSVDWQQVLNYPAARIDGTSYTPSSGITYADDVDGVLFGAWGGGGAGYFYMRNLKIGTTGYGSSDLFSEDFSGGTLANFTSTQGDVSVIADPTAAPAGPEGRVLIALDAGPLEPDPTWTRIDDTDNFVAGYDIQTGKQTELDRTDTGTATVYVNDTAGLLDPMNVSSPYYGKIVGKQILLQLWDPVTLEWVPQWRGKIRDPNYDVNAATNPDGTLVVATVQLECVDIFDYLGGYGLQPGVNGDTPPTGSEGVIFYEDTAGTVDDRIIQILTDSSIDSTRWVVFSGNVKVQETRYDPGDAALTALRDAADSEMPGLANIYVDRFGRFVFHGRYARFDPEGVIAAGPVSTDTWDFHRWKIGDGLAIAGDSTYAQIRVLGFTHGESDVVNSAVSWPAGMADQDMPGQVFEDATSIAAHGKNSLPPMGDLIISAAPTTGNSAKLECAKFAEFFVHYLKDPQSRITSCMVKAISPDDPRAAATWPVLTKADISDIAHTKIGYPGGVGLDMDNYIEGYTKRVRPLNPTHDYVEVEFNLTPTSWSMDPDGILVVPSFKAGIAPAGTLASGVRA